MYPTRFSRSRARTKAKTFQFSNAMHNIIQNTKSGTPGSDAVKVKGVITWVGVHDAVPAEVRLYDRLFVEPHPEAGGKYFLENLNTNSLRVMQAVVGPSLAAARAEDKFQFERLGYFVPDRVDHAVGRPVFNFAVGLKVTEVRFQLI